MIGKVQHRSASVSKASGPVLRPLVTLCMCSLCRVSVMSKSMPSMPLPLPLRPAPRVASQQSQQFTSACRCSPWSSIEDVALLRSPGIPRWQQWSRRCAAEQRGAVHRARASVPARALCEVRDAMAAQEAQEAEKEPTEPKKKKRRKKAALLSFSALQGGVCSCKLR